MLFSCLVFQMPTILLLIHRLSVITGTGRTVSLPVSLTADCRRSRPHTHCPWLISGKISCFPIFHCFHLLGRKSSLPGAEILRHWRKWAVFTCGTSSGNMPGIIRVTHEHRPVNSCSSVWCWASAELHSFGNRNWGMTMPLIIYWPACGWLDRVGLGSRLNCGSQHGWISVFHAATKTVGAHPQEE